MRSFANVIVIVGLSAFANVGNAALENRKLWYDEEDAASFIAALKERQIPFRKDAEGGIWYPASATAAVDEITASIAKRCAGGYSFEDPENRAAFAAQLRRAGIPYRSCRILGQEYLVWEPRYETRALEIRDAIENETMRRPQTKVTK